MIFSLTVTANYKDQALGLGGASETGTPCYATVAKQFIN